MKIENILISNQNLLNLSATVTFDIVETTEDVQVLLKINDLDYIEILTEQTEGTIAYDITSDLNLGINYINLKLVNSTEEYISETFLIKLKEDAYVEDVNCTYTDSTGAYVLEFNLLGDVNFKYNISINIDDNGYQEILTNQIIGTKVYEGNGLTLGTHTYKLLLDDGYDTYETEEYQLEIINHIPQLSTVVVTDISNDGTCNLYYSVKDVEDNTLTHILNINGVDLEINPTNVNEFYSYQMSDLTEGAYECIYCKYVI